MASLYFVTFLLQSLSRTAKRIGIKKVTNLSRFYGENPAAVHLLAKITSLPAHRQTPRGLYLILSIELITPNPSSNMPLSLPSRCLDFLTPKSARRKINRNLCALNKLYYWHREALNSNAEVDYVVQKRQDIVPLEVKSGKKGSMQSLHLFLDEKKSPYGVRFSNETHAAFGTLQVWPLYAVSDFVKGG